VKDRGHMVMIPGLAQFRTPAQIDISHVKIRLVISSLYNSGITDFEIVAKEDKHEVVYTKDDFELPKKDNKTEPNLDKIDKRFNKIERMLQKLVKKADGNKNLPGEQITNKLNALEELSKRILEKESVREIVYTSTTEKSKSPIVEDLDEELYIPEIDIDDMELMGSVSEKIGEVEDVEEAADVLSRLKK
jgi:hypothetical protein